MPTCQVGGLWYKSSILPLLKHACGESDWLLCWPYTPAEVSYQRWISGNVYHICLRKVWIRLTCVQQKLKKKSVPLVASCTILCELRSESDKLSPTQYRDRDAKRKTSTESFYRLESRSSIESIYERSVVFIHNSTMEQAALFNL